MKFSIYFLLVCFFLTILCVVAYSVSFSFLIVFEDKGSPFECGFRGFSEVGFSFSMPFFLISLMFLLFDVEILLVCFYPLMDCFSFYVSGLLWVILFLILFSTIFEWMKGVLSWV